MIAKRGFRDLGVVLGADGQDDAALLELLGVMLQGEMGFAGRASLAEHDAVEPVVPDHAAPQRVVEIEHQTFLRQAPQGGEDAGGEIAIRRRRLRRDFQLALKPAPDVEPGVDPVPLARARDIEQETPVLSRGLDEPIVEPGDDRARRARNHPVIAAEQRLAHVEEGLLNDRGAADLARPAPQRAQFADKSADRVVDLGRCGGERNARDRLPRGEREQHRLRLEPMQRRRRIEKILPVLPVRLRYEPRSAISAAGRRPGSRAADDRRSRRRGWRAGPAEAGRFLQIQSRQRAIELNRFQEPEPMGGERRQAFESVGSAWLDPAPRADRRGNRARSAASSSSDFGGRRLASIRTTRSVER